MANNPLSGHTDEQLLEPMERLGYHMHVAEELLCSTDQLQRELRRRGLRNAAGERRKLFVGIRLNRGISTTVTSSDEEIVACVEETGTITGAAVMMGYKPSTLSSYINRSPMLKARVVAVHRGADTSKMLVGRLPSTPPLSDPVGLEALVQKALKANKPWKIDELADKVDASPRRVRDVLKSLRDKGYNLPDEEDEAIILQRVVPSTNNLHRSLMDGKRLRIGLISDTHIGSKEEALPELELAYDIFAEQGINEVWHAGDLVCGYGIFRTQAMEVKYHTFEDQSHYAAEVYPQRKGITTRMITGNHDVEGVFGQIGANPVQAVANVRDDIDFLGNYSAWIELPGGSFVHLLHGKGGGSYAFSYQAQKLVDSYPQGRKPVILAVGHFHRKGNIEARGVEVLWPGCFEWSSPFLARLGLAPAVGFYILDLTIGDDGSLVQFKPTWYRYFEGRVSVPMNGRS